MRFYGEIGYGISVEDPVGSGVFVDSIYAVQYYGNVTRNTRRLDPNDNLNSDIVVSNSISIVADDYAIEHFLHIKYVEWQGALWTVTNVEVQRPRLVLTLGSVYNGPTA